MSVTVSWKSGLMAPNTWTSLGLLLTALLAGLLTNVSAQYKGEYCNWESFNASCPEGHVIHMLSAKYGRMKMGRCMKRDYLIGCSADVLDLADYRCSGRRTCTISVPNEDMHATQPCPKDLAVYLEATYKCVKVQGVQNKICHTYKPLQVDNGSKGYLASQVTSQTGYGSTACPWILQAQPGQKLNLTLHDFSTSSHDPDSALCQVFARIREPGRIREETVCGGSNRLRQVFTSEGSIVHVEIMQHQSHGNPPHFLLQYEALGCATPVSPYGGWVLRDGEKATVGCNRTSQRWHLVCRGSSWAGTYTNCTSGGPPANSGSVVSGGSGTLGNVFGDGDGFPYGLLVSVMIGIVLGVLLGGGMLALVLACRRRSERKARRQELLSARAPYSAGTTITSDSAYTPSSQKYSGLINTTPSSYAHIWDLNTPVGGTPARAHPAFYAVDPSMDAQQQIQRGDDVSGTTGRCGSQRCGGGGREHIYESPKFSRREVIPGTAPGPGIADIPFYHEFDPANQDQVAPHLNEQLAQTQDSHRCENSYSN